MKKMFIQITIFFIHFVCYVCLMFCFKLHPVTFIMSLKKICTIFKQHHLSSLLFFYS